jgi:hypothetical protein
MCGLVGFVALTVGLFYTIARHAGAPQIKGQAPGFYRMMLGDFEIVGLPTAPSCRSLAQSRLQRRESS